ncbi:MULTISPECIES: hypothetical protein [Streptomyces]|uniref:Uncharacterized protein n=1 Tax=Streptomyces dengpaensis TaxID=2049881 RepID=A0ABM6STY7_9ACTN|nr:MULTISPECIES: hypothetical protein [Streptomyces]AVH58186.1 hypothetical protein C4B68_23160 [Streptomyces dengpaensis]PIB08127.1 hypothetical protein B1C81_17185 [Streptomyces sp. HG99]
MPEHVSILPLMGVAVLALATVIWVVGLVRLLRRDRSEVAVRRDGDTLRAIPHQRRSGPAAESAQLTPEERAAFAGLVRQFGDSRR